MEVWVALSIGAAFLQNVRSALQKSLTGQVAGTVSDSVQRHTVWWIVGALVAAFWLFRRR